MTVAGCLDQVALLKATTDIVFCKTALEIVGVEAMFKTTLKDERPEAKMVTTPEKWLPHFVALFTFTLVSAGACVLFAAYFAVPKTDSSARSIFNGKTLSKEYYHVPPSVQLPDFAELLKIICRGFRNAKRIFLLSGDWRHWFHQICLHPSIARFFGLTMKIPSEPEEWEQGMKVPEPTKDSRRACLPMGWSWSPLLAQSIGFGVIVLNLRKYRVDGAGAREGVQDAPSLPFAHPARYHQFRLSVVRQCLDAY